MVLRSRDVAGARFDVRQIVDQYGGEVSDEQTDTDRDGEVVTRAPRAADPGVGLRGGDGGPRGRRRPEVLRPLSEDVTTQVIDTQVRLRAQRRSIARIDDPAGPGAEPPRHRADREPADPAPGRPGLAGEAGGVPAGPDLARDDHRRHRPRAGRRRLRRGPDRLPGRAVRRLARPGRRGRRPRDRCRGAAAVAGGAAGAGDPGLGAGPPAAPSPPGSGRSLLRRPSLAGCPTAAASPS